MHVTNLGLAAGVYEDAAGGDIAHALDIHDFVAGIQAGSPNALPGVSFGDALDGLGAAVREPARRGPAANPVLATTPGDRILQTLYGPKSVAPAVEPVVAGEGTNGPMKWLTGVSDALESRLRAVGDSVPSKSVNVAAALQTQLEVEHLVQGVTVTTTLIGKLSNGLDRLISMQ